MTATTNLFNRLNLTTRQVAEILFVTPKTVEFHLRHIYRKLDVSSRAELTELLGSGDGT